MFRVLPLQLDIVLDSFEVGSVGDMVVVVVVVAVVDLTLCLVTMGDNPMTESNSSTGGCKASTLEVPLKGHSSMSPSLRFLPSFFTMLESISKFTIF
jgi:hypothetical protein